MLKRAQEPSALSTREEVAPESVESEKSVLRKRRGWYSTRRLIVVLAVLVCVYFFHAPILRGIAGLLIIDEEPADPNYVWIQAEDGVSGNGDRCYDNAARLYHEDTSRRIILTKPYPNRLVQIEVLPCFDVISRRELAARGVPKEAIMPTDGTWQGPWQEARQMETWLKERPEADMVLLCDRFGSRRWRHILNTVLGPDHARTIEILALPDRRYDETNWWKSRCGVKSLFYGYVALTYAWWQGEDIPERDRWDPDDYERILNETPRDG